VSVRVFAPPAQRPSDIDARVLRGELSPGMIEAGFRKAANLHDRHQEMIQIDPYSAGSDKMTDATLHEHQSRLLGILTIKAA